MPTKYQAQVKMTPKANPSQFRSEATAQPSSQNDSAFAKRTSAGWVRPQLSALRKPQEEPVESLAGATPKEHLVYEVAKRTFDMVAGVLLLILAIPIILVAAAIIRLETKGSPFFIQTRLGKNGKPFKIVKLRGMFIDAKTRFASYYDYSRHQDLEFCFHHEKDPRVTRAGNLIRKTSIDELPNFWNVVLGDMSLVGPRPEIPEVLRLYGPFREEYLSVKPGITCLSKCTGRDHLTKRETIEFDLSYIRRRTFTFDLSILWRTFKGVVLRRDVF